MTDLTACRRLAGRAMVDDIRRQIAEGRLRPGEMVRSAASLAKTYKISYVTAHKAFQQLVQEGYCVRVGGKGTFVSEHPPTSSIHFVAIPAYYQVNPFLAHMVEELTMQGAALGIHAMVGRGERTQDFIERIVESNVKAMIRFPGAMFKTDLTETEIWRLLQNKGVNTVMINDFWREGGPFAHVRTDEAAGISGMMDHLISLGHKRILLISETIAGVHPLAIKAHRESFERHGLPYDPQFARFLFPGWEAGREAFVRSMCEQATAAIVMYDMYAIEVATEFLRLGMVLGRDFSLAGFDGIPESATCGLSTVAQPIGELASTAYALLQPGQKSEVPKVLLKPKCIFRESTGPAPKTAHAQASAHRRKP